MKTFKTLYKRNSTGKIQFWEIRVVEQADKSAFVITSFGVLGGKDQETVDHVKKGKSLGKKNATTPMEQAIAEAQSKHEKKLKSGYVESLDDAKKGKLDKIIEGGILPMLAHAFRDHSHKIKYPVIVQPKLDGIRCVAIKRGEEVTLWTRTRKRITSCPHIEDAIRDLVAGDLVLDGELYNHNLRKNFEAIVSAVRKQEPSKESKLVQFHVYDLINESEQENRIKSLFTLPFGKRTCPIKRVKTLLCKTPESVISCVKSFVEQDGYEGGIVRNTTGKYVNKRSYDLQKVKFKDDQEFKIVGIVEGRGRLQGHVGAFTCQCGDETFEVKLSGETSFLKKCFEDHSLWKNKKMTVEFDGWTNARRVPRDPVGLRIREDV